MADSHQINDYLQAELLRRGVFEVKAVEAASWLDARGLLTDSSSRRGLPLRNMLRSGIIDAAEQRPPQKNGRWFITRR
jgi:hypothetical protein